jgi:arabinogalactan endo-1,4-beta-galactosidase
MVQVGNETNGFMCGEKKWENIAALMSAGSKAVREVCPDALVVLHFSNPELANRYAGYAYELNRFNVDYDVFASSYYPFWHGSFENLITELDKVTSNYNKKVVIAETSYAYTPDDTDFHGNTVSAQMAAKDYPLTIQGQADLVRDVIATAAKIENCIGVFYWEGTWIAAGGKSYEENRVLWEKNGSGWASSYVAEYDPDDAGKWYGGCAVDNQAMFDKNGKALESLKVFALVRNGNLDS